MWRGSSYSAQGWKHYLQPAPDVITPGCVAVSCCKFAEGYLITLLFQERMHSAVILQQFVQSPHIHPDVDVACLSVFNKVHCREVKTLNCKCARLAQHLAKYFRHA